jgi:dienelactone hydrolase
MPARPLASTVDSRALGTAALLPLLWLGACTSQPAPAERSRDTVVDRDSGTDASSEPPPEPSSDAALDERDAMPAPADAAELDDAGLPPLPEAAPACGDELDFVGGRVKPDWGNVPQSDETNVDPSKPGRFGVFEAEITLPLVAETRVGASYEISITAGELKGTVYAPAKGTGAAGRPAAGKFPLVVGAPGFQATYQDYAGYFRHFATHGFWVLGIQTRGSSTTAEHDKEALETSQAISWMLDQSPYADSLDPEQISLTGHSKGGKVSFFTAAIDPRVDLVVGWDPSNAGGPPCGPIADLAGTECNRFPVAPNCLAESAQNAKADGILQWMRAETLVFGAPADPLTNPTPEHNSLNFYRGAPSPAALVYFNAGHAAWIEGGVGGILGNAEVIRITKTVQTAKLLSVFKGVEQLENWLPGGAFLAEAAPLVTQVESK